ncbi:uncharacterized protein [Periplaneta americana]|uniref:uncharacterized protein n=1 Tax=Periplaneta americana TaxID=6978 RepID=UPI0037E8E1F5
MTLSVDRCCCGCSLRTGTIIIGAYILTCSVVMTVFGSVCLAVVCELSHRQDFNVTREEDIPAQEITNEKEMLISAIVVGAVQTIVNVLLLVGVKKEERRLVLVWLVSYVILFALSLLGLLTSFFQIPTNPSYQIATVINIGLYMYFLLVVRSYHRSLSAGVIHQNMTMVVDVKK